MTRDDLEFEFGEGLYFALCSKNLLIALINIGAKPLYPNFVSFFDAILAVITALCWLVLTPVRLRAVGRGLSWMFWLVMLPIFLAIAVHGRSRIGVVFAKCAALATQVWLCFVKPHFQILTFGAADSNERPA